MILASKRIQRVAFSPVRKVRDRAKELEAAGRSIIHFEIGEPDFDTPEVIVASAKRAMDDKLTHYGPNRGTIELRREICKKLREENGLTYNPETDILLTAGAAEGILDAILAYIDEGDEVIVFTPAYMNYRNMLNLVGAKTVEIPLSEENNFQIDPKELEDRITDKTKMLIINDPQNPSGTVYDPCVLEQIAKIAVKHDLLVLSDEIYERIIYDGVVHTSIATFPGMKERTIVINGFSKAYAMTGWRVGYVATEGQLLLPILKLHQYNTTCLPVFVQRSLSEQMNSTACKKAIDNMVSEFSHRRKLICDGIRQTKGLSMPEPRGAFYAFVNVRGLGVDGAEFAEALLEEVGVAVVPGIAFGEAFSGYVRLSYAASTNEIAEGIMRIQTFVNKMSLA